MSNPFTSKATSSGGDYASEQPPEGSHQAALVGLIDLGLQEVEYQGVVKNPVRKVFLIWELVKEKAAGLTRNHVIGKEYTMSFHTKAALRALLKGWRGKDLADGEEYDLTKCLGQPCLVNIVNETSVDFRVFAKLQGVTQLPKGMEKIKPTLPQVCWFIGCGKPFPTDNWLPWSYGRSLEYISMVGEANLAKGARSNGKTNGNHKAQETAAVGAGAQEEPEPF